MIRLKQLEIEGFGPFAEAETINFASEGVTVVYGANMRGKTVLHNAVSWVLYGEALAGPSQKIRPTVATNRYLASHGEYGFHVSLSFDFDDVEYQIYRSYKPQVAIPEQDTDYQHTFQLRKGGSVLHETARDEEIRRILPHEIARFFLFDGELLSEYRELLRDESKTGRRISEAIERILGIPVIQKGRIHLLELTDRLRNIETREAKRVADSEQIAQMMDQTLELKKAHETRIQELENEKRDLEQRKKQLGEYLQSVSTEDAVLERLEKAEKAKEAAQSRIEQLKEDLKTAMKDAWRTLLVDKVTEAREKAKLAFEDVRSKLVDVLRREALSANRCEVCEQPIPDERKNALEAQLATQANNESEFVNTASRIAALISLQSANNSGEIDRLWRDLSDARFDYWKHKEEADQLSEELKNVDSVEIQRTRGEYEKVISKIQELQIGIEKESSSFAERDRQYRALSEKLKTVGSPEVTVASNKRAIAENAASVMATAVEEYKQKLRNEVEYSATQLFKTMTTEKEDYAGLAINENYGLAIRHIDGRLEDMRSSGAEHVVALSLMAALQQNAPLKGPIVMDSPFGRLDPEHIDNVLHAVPSMAPQVILLVQPTETTPERARQALGSSLMREYWLRRLSSRHTKIVSE